MNIVPLAELGLILVADAAKIHGVTPEAVQQWIRAGRLPVIVVGTGRSVVYLLRVVDVESFKRPKRPKRTTLGPRKPEQRDEKTKRDAAILASRIAGATLREIARQFGLTHEGVRQVIARMGAKS